MAEELEWDLEAFDKAFQEVLDKGLAKADLKARLVWLPNALKYNKPESPNVVKSWAKEIDLLPECELKDEAIRSILEYLETLGDSYKAPFLEACSPSEKPLPKAFTKPLPKPSFKPSGEPSFKAMPNQEQEQEQEQEKEKKEKKKTASKTFSTWLETCKANSEKPINENNHIFEYAKNVGLNDEMLRLHWRVFKQRYLENNTKKYSDWRKVFANSVRGNWFGIWRANGDGFALSTVGVQAHREHALEAA
jgi:hypothetical protein